MKHIDELTQDEAVQKSAQVAEWFDGFIRSASAGLDMCPGCTYTLVKGYIIYLEDLRQEKAQAVEH